jgi:transcriptional regulator GlxA family with amidase domain
MKELHYWLLQGEHGVAIRQLAFPDGQAERVSAAARLLRAEFRQPVAIERLAAAAGMSVSTFRRRFKALTSLTPIQFQKELKLVEARRLMLGEGRSAGQAAFAVGYESVSHFTRDYGRLFGASPKRDVRALTERAPVVSAAA